MDKEVYSTKEFADYAKKYLVLVKVDFPMKKAQSTAVKRGNEQLKEKYNIEGFPTLIVVDTQGKEVGREVGYGGDGPKAVIAQLANFRSK